MPNADLSGFRNKGTLDNKGTFDLTISRLKRTIFRSYSQLHRVALPRRALEISIAKHTKIAEGVV